MRGHGAERFCEQCSTAVHDLSQMTKLEAQVFLARRGGQRVCVRYRADAEGNLQFRPAPPVRPMLALAALGLGLAACTGYVEADAMETPEDALTCEDGSGYTIPFAETSMEPETVPETVPETETVPQPETEPSLQPIEHPEPEATDVVPTADPDPGIFLGQTIAIEATGEGCPLPSSGENVDEGEIMGDMPAPRSSPGEQRRLERKWRREQRRAERRTRRAP